MTEMERVWMRIRDRAGVHGAANVLVSMADARRIVAYICGRECKRRPPNEAIEHLARELVRLTLEATDLPKRRPYVERGVI